MTVSANRKTGCINRLMKCARVYRQSDEGPMVYTQTDEECIGRLMKN